ncbi:MAG: PadR family transcriptional regulator [Candidatus Bathyarchaeia archaeon]|jgi:PadR family transcriptional regulator PadR
MQPASTIVIKHINTTSNNSYQLASRYNLMSETYKDEIVQHIIRNLLEIELLRILQTQPTWGYHIKKQVEEQFNIKLRHGALYPALKALETRGFLESKTQQKSGRARKVYSVTQEGKNYLQTYRNLIKEMLDEKTE